ncbi:MAG: immunoglobulin domain-containing protein, partial [Limisphaerales bacterium]
MKKLIADKIFILTGLAVLVSVPVRAAFTPIPLAPASYNADVIVEKTAIPSLKVVTTASVDQGTANGANTWMEAGFDPANPTFGLPAPGAIITALSNANYSFQMAPSYTAPNGFLIDTVITNATATFVTPTAYTLLSFLGSGGNGGDVIGVKVYHQDGSFEMGGAYQFGCPDWFNGTSNVVFIANERVGSTLNFTYNNINSNNPRLYSRDIALTNTTSPVIKVDLFYVSGPANSHNDVVAISGATTVGGPVGPITLTGYTYDFIVEKEAAKRGRVFAADGVTPATTQSMDNTNNTANSWFEQGYNINNPGGSGRPAPDPTLVTDSGLPVAGSVVTNASGSRAFTLPASYTANNATYLSPAIPNATMTLAAPTAVSALSFLASAGNGPVSPIVIVNHQNGVAETNSLVIPDWFNVAAPFVVAANGRVAVDTAQFNLQPLNRTPRMFSIDLALTETVSPVTTIDLVYTNTGGRAAIFALSGATGPTPPIITTQPLSTNVNDGSTITFTVAANGVMPFTYQWQKGTNGIFSNLADGGHVSGATTATLTIVNTDLNDAAQYRVLVSNAGGSELSTIATLVSLSNLTDVTSPGDANSVFGGPDSGSATEKFPNVIDNTTQKWLNSGANGGTPFLGPVGVIVTPTGAGPGATIVSALRFYTANDSEGRDPADYKLEGSFNGVSWTLISSNALSLPSGRNAGGLALSPLTQNIQEVRFANTNGYLKYRLTFTRTKIPLVNSSMQIGEVEFLGVHDVRNYPPDVTVPALVKAYSGGPLSVTAIVSSVNTPGVRWQKNIGGVFGDLADGGAISGSQTTTLTINPTTFSDAGDYRVIATNSFGASTSSVVKVQILSTLTDVTTPGDPITAFGGEASSIGNGNAPSAIDDFNTVIWQNGGSGLNAPAGFPPFGGPVGLVVTPAIGATRVTGLRIYTSIDNPPRDPADFRLEGSNDGTSYTLISSNALTLPDGRADNSLPFNPIDQSMQELLFANNVSYTSYRITFTNTKNNNVANSLQIGEIELLGVQAAAGPTMTISRGTNGAITITSSSPGTLQSTTSLNSPPPPIVWQNEGPINGSVIITPIPGVPAKFYRVV